MNFEPGFFQYSDFCAVHLCKLVHIYLDNGSFAYLNNISENLLYKTIVLMYLMKHVVGHYLDLFSFFQVK